MLARFAALAAFFAAAATASDSLNGAEELLRRVSEDASNTSSASVSTPSGFVYNGTVGTYACALDGQVDGQRVYSPDSVPGAECADALPPVYPYNELRIRAPDDSMRLTFVPHGASVKEVWVKDRTGAWQDLILGFDNSTNLGTDKVRSDLPETLVASRADNPPPRCRRRTTTLAQSSDATPTASRTAPLSSTARRTTPLSTRMASTRSTAAT